MPTLIIEDGSIVENANSYVDLSYLSTYLSDRGISITSTDTEKEQFILLGMDYIESFRNQFKGSKSLISQPLQWPRQNVYIDGNLIDRNHIPVELKKSLCQLVVEQSKGKPLFPEPITSVVEGQVIEEQLGPIKTRYSDSSSKTASSISIIKFASVLLYLNLLLKCNGGYTTDRL